MVEYKVNKFITLKLENGKTNIYVAEEKFNQCKYILLNFTRENIAEYDELNSIDEIIDKYNRENEFNKTIITPEEEFFGHCSNLQAWNDNNYSLDILHSSLSFPLLAKLVELGDQKAKIFLKEEILRRIERGGERVVKYFLNTQYLEIFECEELELLFEMTDIEQQDTLKAINKLMNRTRILEGLRKIGKRKIIIN